MYSPFTTFTCLLCVWIWLYFGNKTLLTKSFNEWLPYPLMEEKIYCNTKRLMNYSNFLTYDRDSTRFYISCKITSLKLTRKIIAIRYLATVCEIIIHFFLLLIIISFNGVGILYTIVNRLTYVQISQKRDCSRIFEKCVKSLTDVVQHRLFMYTRRLVYIY